MHVSLNEVLNQGKLHSFSWKKADLSNGVSLSLGLLQPPRVPHLQLLYCRQKRLVRHRDLCPELRADALCQSRGTETGYQLTDVLFPPATVHFCVFQGGPLKREGGREGGREGVRGKLIALLSYRSKVLYIQLSVCVYCGTPL